MLKPPIFARAGDLEYKLTFACTSFASIDMAHLRNDGPIKDELFGIDPRDRPIDAYKIAVPSPFLFAFNTIKTAGIRYGRGAEMVPAYPLKRKKVPA